MVRLRQNLIACILYLSSTHIYSYIEAAVIEGTLGEEHEAVTDTSRTCWKSQRQRHRLPPQTVEANCFHTMAGHDGQDYPITEEMFARSVPFVPQTLRLQRAIAKAEKGGDLNVLVIGGSMTLGTQCEELFPVVRHAPMCSWVQRLKEWLVNRFPRSKITVTNGARGGCSIVCHLHSLPYFVDHANMQVDIVVLDTAVNDVIHVRDAKHDWDSVAAGDNEDLASYLEAAVRFFLTMPSEPAVIFMEGMHSASAEPRIFDLAEEHRKIAEDYGVPMTSFRHAVWPVFDKPDRKEMNLWFPNGPHPGPLTHQLFTDLLTHFIESVYLEMCKYVMSEEAIQRDMFGGDTRPRASIRDPPIQARTQEIWEKLGTPNIAHHFQISVEGGGLDATSPRALKPISVETKGGRGWVFEDFRAGMKAWIVERSPEAKITFRVDCGEGEGPANLVFGFIRSYNLMGRAALLIDGKREQVVDASWDRPYSVWDYHYLAVPRQPFNFTFESLYPWKGDQSIREGHKFQFRMLMCD